jgi:hypothetical protein
VNAPPIAKSRVSPSPHGPGRDMHRSARWRKFRLMILTRNPMCARLHNGQRCTRGAVIVHHLKSPAEVPALQFVSSNVVPLCREDHPNTPGTPHWIAGVDYVPTKGYGEPL